jgi:hypothetical protein
MDDLMQRLARAKMVMDKSDTIKSNKGDVYPQQSMVQDFDVPTAKYNIPKEFLQENQSVNQPYLSSIPRDNIKPFAPTSVEAIKNSKLPEEIKKLMIEHPISQPAQNKEVLLSNDLIERASRLMKNESSNNYIPESTKTKPQSPKDSQIDYGLIKQMIKEVVEDTLHKNGLIPEKEEKTNELFSFRVGKHIFEGKISKIKKLS